MNKDFESAGESAVRENLASARYNPQKASRAQLWLNDLERVRLASIEALKSSNEAEALSISREALSISRLAFKIARSERDIAVIASIIAAISMMIMMAALWLSIVHK